MELKHREEVGSIKQQMNQLMIMVQRNSSLANIKPEILIEKYNITNPKFQFPLYQSFLL